MLGVASAIAWGAVATGCAKSDPIADGSGGAGGAGGAGSSQGGNGAAGPGPGPGPGPTTTNTTSGPQCDEDPCKLISPQCGCDEGACSIDGNGGRHCVVAGTREGGDICTADTLCAPGSVCINNEGGPSTCAEYCETADDCQGPGGQCVYTLSSSPGVRICSDNCDPFAATGCSAPNFSCQIFTSEDDVIFTSCELAGTLGNQEICEGDSQCAPGYTCLPTSQDDNRCFHWCIVGQPCPDAGTVCTSFDQVLGVNTFGVCNPE